METNNGRRLVPMISPLRPASVHVLYGTIGKITNTHILRYEMPGWAVERYGCTLNYEYM